MAAEPASVGALNDNIYNYLQLLRSDSNSAKVDLINKIMRLSAEDAGKFWPIYRDYGNELGKLALNRGELTGGLVDAHRPGTFDNTKAKEMAKRWFKSQKARLGLLEKYDNKLEKTLSAVQAGQFLQIENQVGALHRSDDCFGNARCREPGDVSGWARDCAQVPTLVILAPAGVTSSDVGGARPLPALPSTQIPRCLATRDFAVAWDWET